MADELVAVNLPLPVAGVEVDSSYLARPGGKSELVRNYLAGRPGRMPLRGTIDEVDPFPLYPGHGNDDIPVAPWQHGDNVLVPVHNALQGDLGRVRQPWVATYRRPGSALEFAEAARIIHRNMATGARNYILALDAQTAPGVAHTRLRGNVYGPGYSATLGVTWDGSPVPLTRLLKWDGTAAAPTVLTNAPLGVQGIASHQQRVWCAAGAASATGPFEPSALFYTVQGWDGSDTAAAWQDGVSGLTNLIRVADDADIMVALVSLENKQLIFRRRSVYVMTGYSAETYAVRQLAGNLGCIDPRAVARVGDSVVWADAAGVYEYDGAQIQRLSIGITTLIQPLITAAAGDNAADGGFVSIHPLSDDSFALNIGAMALTTAGVRRRDLSLIYHRPSQTWSQLTTLLLRQPALATAEQHPTFGFRTPRGHFAFGARTLYDTSYVVEPERQDGGALADFRGYDRAAQAPTRVGYAAQFRTTRLPMGDVVDESQLNRLIVEYRERATGTPLPTALSIALNDRAQQVASVLLPATAAADPSTQVEVDDMDYKTVKWLDALITHATANGGQGITASEINRIIVLAQRSKPIR